MTRIRRLIALAATALVVGAAVPTLGVPIGRAADRTDLEQPLSIRGDGIVVNARPIFPGTDFPWSTSMRIQGRVASCLWIGDVKGTVSLIGGNPYLSLSIVCPAVVFVDVDLFGSGVKIPAINFARVNVSGPITDDAVFSAYWVVGYGPYRGQLEVTVDGLPELDSGAASGVADPVGDNDVVDADVGDAHSDAAEIGGLGRSR